MNSLMPPSDTNNDNSSTLLWNTPPKIEMMSISESNQSIQHTPSSIMSSTQNNNKSKQQANMYKLRHTMIISHFDRVTQCMPTGVCIQGSAFSKFIHSYIFNASIQVQHVINVGNLV